MQIYLIQNGQQIGPFTVEQVRGMLAAQSITLTDQGWHEGLAGWQPLNTFLPSPPKPTAPFPAYAAPRPVQMNVNQGASISVPRSKSSPVKKIFAIVFGSTLALILIVCALNAAGIIDTERGYVIHSGNRPDMYYKELGSANNALGMELKWTVKSSAKVMSKTEAEKTMNGIQSILKAGGLYAPLKLEDAGLLRSSRQ